MTAAPYPADTRAKGWRFEIDIERIRQSDTWALATPEVRPWLLLLWVTAWEQVPCGSLPNDDALIAARIGMTQKAFSKARPVLMRGWAEADDGRLYHSTVTARVLAMLETKRKEAERKAAYRARMDAERSRDATPVPRDRHGTDTGQTEDERGSDPGRDATGTGTGTGTGLREREIPPPSGAPLADARQKSRGVRLPTGWSPGDDGLAFAESQGLRNGRAAKELDRFRDYWASQPGQKGVKTDWLATWRNWVRKAAETAPKGAIVDDVFAGSH